MDPIFTLPYSEYAAISAFSKIFTKKKYAILVPSSRQQAGIDFAVMKGGTQRVLRVQVKSSRAYEHVDTATSKNKNHKPRMTLWFGNFRKRYRPGMADLYLLLGVYPAYSLLKPVSRAAWKTILLVIGDREMGRILRSLQTPTGQDERFFYVGFDPPERGSVDEVTLTRGAGARRKVSWSRFLLDNRRHRILRMLH